MDERIEILFWFISTVMFLACLLNVSSNQDVPGGKAVVHEPKRQKRHCVQGEDRWGGENHVL